MVNENNPAEENLGLAGDAASNVSTLPPVAAADRFEVLADDLVRRIDMAARKSPDLRATLGAFGVLEAAKRLAVLVAEHEHEIAKPLGEQATFLIERQGEMIRALKEKLAVLVVAAATAERTRDGAILELNAWRKRERADGLTNEQAVLKGEARAVLESWRRLECARCGKAKSLHVVEGECPSGPARVTSSMPCVACGGQVERREVEGAAVWWCAACAGRAGDETAGIRGTGQ